MTSTPDIPTEPLAINDNNRGFVPHIGLHRRGDRFYQESSYSHFWLAGSMFLAALVVTLLPWHTVALGGIKLKYYVAGGGLWGAICAGLPYFIRNKLGQQIIVDLGAKTVLIDSDQGRQTIEWKDILGIQICHQRVPGNSNMTGYQLNLVWRDQDGALKRHCLLKHAIKSLVVALGKSYEQHFQFRFVRACP